MLRLRVAYADPAELRRALDQEIARGVLLVKVDPPAEVEFRAPVALELATAAAALVVEAEVVSVLPGVGLAVAFPPGRVPEARALLDGAPPGSGPAVHELVPDRPVAARPAAGADKTMAEKIQLALHGTREDRAAILRDANRSLHAFVLKSPQVTVDEVTGWAKSAQTNPDFLKQIGDRKDWLGRPAIAQALARNPKTPPELAVRALDHVGVEALRQMAKGAGVPPHVTQAARRKVIGK